MCEFGKVENEIHLLIECEIYRIYHNLRHTFLGPVVSTNKSLKVAILRQNFMANMWIVTGQARVVLQNFICTLNQKAKSRLLRKMMKRGKEVILSWASLPLEDL